MRSPRLSTLGEKSSVWGVVATFLIAAAMVFVITGFPVHTDYSTLASAGIWPDVLHERATAWEAIHGDPYRPMSAVMAEHGYPEMVGGLSPRTPAALLGQLPLLLIPETALMPVVTLIITGLTFVDLWLTGRITGSKWAQLIWLGPLLFVSYPVVTSISYGSVSVMTTVTLILLAWAYRDKDWAGLPLGLAAAMRLWPGLVIVGFWISGRRRVALISLGVFVGVNALGLLLPGATFAGSVDALVRGGGDWINHNQNASLALVLARFDIPAVATTLLASAVGVGLAIRKPSHAIPICAVAALIASPLSWPAYLLVALPVLVGWAQAGGRLPVLVLGAPLVLWMFTPVRWKGHIGFFILVMLLIYTVAGGGRFGLASRAESTTAAPWRSKHHNLVLASRDMAASTPEGGPSTCR